MTLEIESRAERRARRTAEGIARMEVLRVQDAEDAANAATLRVAYLVLAGLFLLAFAAVVLVARLDHPAP